MTKTANRCLPYLQSRPPRMVKCLRCKQTTHFPRTNYWTLVGNGDKCLCGRCERFEAESETSWPYVVIGGSFLFIGFVLAWRWFG